MRFIPGIGWVVAATQLAPDSPTRNPYANVSDAGLRTARHDESSSSSWLGRRARNTFGSIGAGVFDTVNFLQRQVTGRNYTRDDPSAPLTQIENEQERRRQAKEKHRDVTPLPTGFDEVGAGFFRIQEEVLRATFADQQEKVRKEAEAKDAAMTDMARDVKYIANWARLIMPPDQIPSYRR